MPISQNGNGNGNGNSNGNGNPYFPIQKIWITKNKMNKHNNPNQTCYGLCAEFGT